MFRCPGQDQRFWKPGDIFEIDCPHCGATVEFWKDEPAVKCRECKQSLANPKLDMGCAKWCQYAEQCLGAVSGAQTAVLRDQLLAEVRKLFAADRKLCERMTKVLEFAEKIQADEGGDPLAVKAAAILCDLPCDGKGKNRDCGMATERALLTGLSVVHKQVDRICELVALRRSGESDGTVESAVLADAVALTDIASDSKSATSQPQTAAGRRILEELTDGD